MINHILLLYQLWVNFVSRHISLCVMYVKTLSTAILYLRTK